MRGGVECGRRVASARSARTEEEAVGRHGCGAAIRGRDDEGVADVVPASDEASQLSNRIKFK